MSHIEEWNAGILKRGWISERPCCMDSVIYDLFRSET